MRILFVAADKMEFAGAPDGAAAAQRLPLKVDWARQVRLGRHDGLLVANGVGAPRAAAAVEAACAAFRPEAIVSTGFCGALDPALGVGTVVVATRILGGSDFPALPVRSGRAFHAGAVCSIDRVARTAGEKAGLRSSGACAVEMEAAGVAARARDHGLPFYCIRAVTDLAGETLQNDFNSALRSDGHFATISILASALRHPAARLPELVRLRRRSISASQTLGNFLADCNF